MFVSIGSYLSISGATSEIFPLLLFPLFPLLLPLSGFVSVLLPPVPVFEPVPGFVAPLLLFPVSPTLLELPSFPGCVPVLAPELFPVVLPGFELPLFPEVGIGGGNTNL